MNFENKYLTIFAYFNAVTTRCKLMIIYVSELLNTQIHIFIKILQKGHAALINVVILRALNQFLEFSASLLLYPYFVFRSVLSGYTNIHHYFCIILQEINIKR